jgi:hypothetical protein
MFEAVSVFIIIFDIWQDKNNCESTRKEIPQNFNLFQQWKVSV